MALRIAGVLIPNEKRVEHALIYIYGISLTTSRKIIKEAGVNLDTRVKNLTENEANKLRDIIEKKYKIEGDLRREVFSNIKHLKDVGCYRGLRHSKGLPTRGQRTKTNSRTVRGNVRKTSGSGRKPSAQKT